MGRTQSHEWLDSLRLVRMYAGDQAIPTLCSCLDFEAAWSGRNGWILNEVQACREAPSTDYVHDWNREGTPAELEQNRRTLAILKKLASPVPAAALALSPLRSFPQDQSAHRFRSDSQAHSGQRGDHVRVSAHHDPPDLSSDLVYALRDVPSMYELAPTFVTWCSIPDRYVALGITRAVGQTTPRAVAAARAGRSRRQHDALFALQGISGRAAAKEQGTT